MSRQQRTGFFLRCSVELEHTVLTAGMPSSVAFINYGCFIMHIIDYGLLFRGKKLYIASSSLIFSFHDSPEKSQQIIQRQTPWRKQVRKLQNNINHYCMCLSSQQTPETKCEEQKTQTQTFQIRHLHNRTRERMRKRKDEEINPFTWPRVLRVWRVLVAAAVVVAGLNTVRSSREGRQVLPVWSPPPSCRV